MPTRPQTPLRPLERPRRADGTLCRVTEYFGQNVFDAKAMAKRLSASDAKAMTRIMAHGGKIDGGLAERVASAAKEWAIEKGATHYCHWFQPQTGSTAEKHDAFLWFDNHQNPVERFTGRELLQSEPDASSFPSGGMRSTFEARGYTGWDPSSPMFVMETENGKTLYIPSVFISYHGEALDHKAPLLRSMNALSQEATRTLHLLGHKEVQGVTVTVGPEQEFFVVDRHLAEQRPDLMLSGRTVFGAKPPKGQELEDHYFAHIPSRVHAFINEVEVELYKVGVPVKTRHNEVAPAQFEIAPIFENANVAADHNHLAMKVLRTVGARHGLTVLFHEKPFGGVNGSGKHVNWSLCDDTGRNLLEPGETPHQNLVFLTFLCATVMGIHNHADVLRASIASAGNDHRLGANEAPPAIVSVFLGQTLDKILNALEEGKMEGLSAEQAMIDLGVAHLQEVAKDNTDRNRTSPFAFTGNKFEFRAVGSAAPVSAPTAILNGAVAHALQTINGLLEKKAQGGPVAAEGVLEVLQGVIAQTKAIRFEGNGYGHEWRVEAAQRGLGNFANTPEALEVWKGASATTFLENLGILNAQDAQSRLAVQQERYIKQRLIEVNCAIQMAQTGALPAAVAHLGSLVQQAHTSAQLGLASPVLKMAQDLSSAVGRAQGALEALNTALGKWTAQEEALDHHHLSRAAHGVAHALMPRLDELREAVDTLETLVPANLWPFPTYTKMLFGFV